MKEFLVSLGWKVDETGMRKFAGQIAVQTVAVQELASAIVATGKEAVQFVENLSDKLEDLYFASQRTKSSADNIAAFGFALGQVGGTAGAAQSSLENLAAFVRNNPGGEGYLTSLIGPIRDENGKIQDITVSMQKLAVVFRNMQANGQQGQALRRAQMLGIDEKTLLGMEQGIGEFGAEYHRMLAASGVDLNKATKASHEWMNSLRGLRAGIEILGFKIAQQALPYLKKFTEQASEWLTAHAPQIANAVVWVIDSIGRVIRRVLQFGEDARTAWNSLSGSSKIVVEALAAIGAAWLLLNSEFLMSPVGIILALGAAILLLYDDYKTWKEGGKSLIDWDQWAPAIERALVAMAALGDAIANLHKKLSSLLGEKHELHLEFNGPLEAVNKLIEGIEKLTRLLHGDFRGEWEDVVTIGNGLLRASPLGLAADGLGLTGGGKEPEGLPWLSTFGIGGNLKEPEGVRGERNNNPGNIEFAGQRGAHLEDPAGDGSQRFASFETSDDGLFALAKLLTGKNYAAGGKDTIREIITKFAPASENNTAEYIKTIVDAMKGLGAGADTKLNLNDPKVLAGLMNGIITVENGRNIYAAQTGVVASQVDAKPGVTMHQETNINVNTKTDNAVNVAQAVASIQRSVNTNILRNTQLAVH